MKKILMVGAILSSLAFAKGNMNNSTTTNMTGMNMSNNTSGIQNANLTEAQQKDLLALKEVHHKAMAPLTISVQEKDLAIKKELLADKPDWAKIETLTKEKAVIEGQIELLMLKHKVEIKEKFGFSMNGNCDIMNTHKGMNMGKGMNMKM